MFSGSLYYYLSRFLVVLGGRLYPVAVISSQLVVGVLGHGELCWAGDARPELSHIPESLGVLLPLRRALDKVPSESMLNQAHCSGVLMFTLASHSLARPVSETVVRFAFIAVDRF